ncbi:hypothetical protein Pcinc_030437, partial [Petrolisthes cinctipes]
MAPTHVFVCVLVLLPALAWTRAASEIGIGCKRACENRYGRSMCCDEVARN